MPTDDQLASLRAMAERPGITDLERAFARTAVGVAGVGYGHETDPARIDVAIEDLRQVVAGTASDDPQRILHLQSLALALMRRSEVTGNGGDLAEAADVLAEARDLAGGPGHQLWVAVNATLAVAHRRRGEVSGARQVGLEGLRGYAWSVLLQAEASAAELAARDAAEAAMELARWCLVDNAPGDAVRALDAGRGLVLFSAIGFRDVMARLDDAGRPDLAGRWRAATASGGPAAAPTDLRREVLTALSGGPAPEIGDPAGLLDPPSIPEIRSALAALDADALVYLVPGKSPTTGWAVIVPVDGSCCYLPLPQLLLDDDVDVERYLAAVSRRDAVLADPDPGPVRDSGRDMAAHIAETRFLAHLDGLCDWAWRAAVGPLLERYLATRPAPASGRPPRVVLVPMGNLARIPWQAARRGDRRYAVELAAFSQAAGDQERSAGVLRLDPATERLDVLGTVELPALRATAAPVAWSERAWPALVEPFLLPGGGSEPRRVVVAATGALGRLPLPAVFRDRYAAGALVVSHVATGRQVIELARRMPMPVTEDAVFVANPRGDRESATVDAIALRRLFYPRSIGLGRTVEQVHGAGTPAEVLAHLPGPAGPGASMLHLGCRLRATGRPALELVGPPDLAGPAWLDVEQIGAQARDRPDPVTGGLVILPVDAGADPDRWVAFADAMLAAGSTSVIGWLWPVPAPVASLMLFVLHAKLVDEGIAPALAVGAVQRWMLDPGRDLPSHLPAGYVATVDGVDLTDPGYWAALCHRGRG